MKAKNKNIGPFIKNCNSNKKMLINLSIALLFIIAFSVYKNGVLPFNNGEIKFIEIFYPILFVLLPALVSFIIETLFGIIFLKKRGKNIINFSISTYSFFPGLFLGLILPINSPLWMSLIGAALATIFGKILFGGYAKKIFNPALFGYTLILLLSIFILKDNFLINSNKLLEIGTYNNLIKPYGNLTNFLLGTVPNAISTTSALVCILAYIYLSITKVIKWKIPLVYVATVFLISFLIGNINSLELWYPLLQIISGSLLFGAIFMATDPVTSPTTSQGQILYGLFLGIVNIVISYFMPKFDSVFISIIIMNLFVKLLDNIGAKSKMDFRFSLIPYIIAWSLIIGIGFYIGNSYLKESKDKELVFEIISKDTMGNKTTYIVTQNEYNLSIKGEIIFNNNKVISYKILEHDAAYYQKIIDYDYLDTLISYQYHLDEVDSISGAINTSKSVKKLLENTINDYKKNNTFEEIIEEEKDFDVISIDKEDNTTIYTVYKKTENDHLKLRITFEYDMVKELTVLEQNDPDFNIIIDEDYINTLLNKQQMLDEVEIIKENQNTSKALKDALFLTINYYKDSLNI